MSCCKCKEKYAPLECEKCGYEYCMEHIQEYYKCCIDTDTLLPYEPEYDWSDLEEILKRD